MSNIYTVYQQNPGLQEAVKTLRANVEFAGMDEPIKSVLMTSTYPAEGKSTVGLCLAMAMAEAGRLTLVVENDFRRPQLANWLKLRAPSGLADVLTDKRILDDAIIETDIPSLFFLDVGGKIANPVEALSSQRYAGIIQQVKEMFDFVVFDAPPMGAFIDGALIAPQVDGVLLVIQAGRVGQEPAQGVVDQLKKAHARLLGVVLNDVERSHAHYGYYYYGSKRERERRRHWHRRAEQMIRVSRGKKNAEPVD